MTPPRFSIVIPLLNLRHCVEVTTRALQLQCRDVPGTELIFVDDGSSDGTVEYLAGLRETMPCTIIRHPRSLGRSAAKNAGWQRATGDMVVFLDGDMLPAPGWLRAYERACVADPSWDVVSGARFCIDCDPRRPDLLDHLSRLAGAEPAMLLRGDAGTHVARLALLAEPAQYPLPLHVELERQLRIVCARHPESVVRGYALITSNVAVRRELLEKTGGFDLMVRRVEDTDLGIRLAEMGCRFTFAEEAAAYHLNEIAQADRGMTPLEAQSFLLRHPHRAVFLLFLWASGRLQAQGNPLLSLRTGLIDIAAQASDPASPLWRAVTSRYASLIPGRFDAPRETIARYFQEMSGMPASELDALLTRAVDEGLLVARDADGVTRFDIHHTANWLRTRTHFHEYVLVHASFSYTHPTARQAGMRTAAPIRVSYQGRHVVRFDIDAARADLPAVMAHVSLPVPHRCQTGVRFTAFEPEDLRQYVDVRQGTLRFPLSAAAASGGRIAYTFACDVHEDSPDGSFAPVHAYGDKGSMRVTYPDAVGHTLAQLLDRILEGRSRSRRETVRRIFDWIVRNVGYASTTLADYTVLEIGLGTCAHQARLFVNLCRLSGIAAVEQCGALLLRGEDAAPAITTHTTGYGPFDHTWAEYMDDEGQWRVAEFIARGYGRWQMTPRNVRDPGIRRLVVERSDRLAEYYFGHNDPYRLYASASSTRQPPFTFTDGKRDEARLLRLLAGTHHTLSCEYAIDAADTLIAANAAEGARCEPS